MSPSYRTVGYIISDADELLAGGFLGTWCSSSSLIPENHAGATLAFNWPLQPSVPVHLPDPSDSA